MYMGEIVRLIILDLLQQELLFLGHRDTYADYKTPLYNRGGFYTKFVSTVETDEGKLQFFDYTQSHLIVQASNSPTHVESWKTLVFEIRPSMIARSFSISADKSRNEQHD